MLECGTHDWEKMPCSNALSAEKIAVRVWTYLMFFISCQLYQNKLGVSLDVCKLQLQLLIEHRHLFNMVLTPDLDRGEGGSPTVAIQKLLGVFRDEVGKCFSLQPAESAWQS